MGPARPGRLFSVVAVVVAGVGFALGMGQSGRNEIHGDQARRITGEESAGPTQATVGSL
ncbi:hypothetical protein SDC9_207004 [bioreactor metagenome]|uniref:Uncharacterized protein n=1 Tax=bioreactor metagenome TaxID=1076179 RepID=A0A645JI48_9ZZZZ